MMEKIQKASLLGGMTELLALVICALGIRYRIPGVVPYNVLDLPYNPICIGIVMLGVFAVLTVLWFFFFRFMKE